VIFDRMHEVIGRTPLVRLRMDAPDGVEVFAKLEMHNPFAMKDRVARNIILTARATGVLLPGAPIVESSSGTMALGVALVGRALGHEVHIVTDPRIDRVTMAKLRAFGCELHVVSEMSGQGWQSARLERLERLMRDLPGAFWPQQYSNPDNPGAYRELAGEVLADLGAIDVLVGSVGSGGSLCGSARAFRRTLPDLRVVGVDCVGSVLFGQPDRPKRLQSGLGNSLLPKNLDRGLVDEIHWLNDREAFEATEALAREQQIFAGNTSGSVYRVLGDVAARARPGERIVGIFPDRGDRYADTVHNPDYWAGQGLDSLPSRGAPTVIAYGEPTEAWARAATVVDSPRHLLFIEANTSGTGMLAMRSARDLGLLPVLLTKDPARYAGLAATGCRVLTCDTDSAPALRAAIQDGFRREEIAGLTTTSDFYAQVAAGLAEWLGLPANPPEAVARCRDKAALRATLARAGVRQPRFAVVTDPSGPVDQAGFPCVVKPSDDSGSTNVLLCGDAAEARAQARRIIDVRTNIRGLPTARTALVEQFLDGPEFSVEMFGWNGRTECVGITAKQVGSLPHFVETGHLFPADLPPSMAASIADAVRAALAACDLRLGPSHTEVRLTADGPAIIEINPRLAGGMIPELIRLSTGVDLLEQQLRVAAGGPAALTGEPAGYAGIRFLLAEREGVLTAIDGVAQAENVPGVERVTRTARTGARVRPARDAYDRLGHVIARGGSPEEVTKILDIATQLIHLTVV
jgi:S-sulfo-L-cysteine synthase (3-phospho-L-serine-dependent)